jgi:hypothetical protein
MTSYQDVVTPASKEALSDWLTNALAYSIDSWRFQRLAKKQPKTKEKWETAKHPAEGVLRRVLRFAADSDSDYDPWQAPKKLGTEDEELRLIGQEWMPSLESAIGRMPRKSIIHAPLPKAIEYGCSDAIYTGHCMIRLAERRAAQQKIWTINEEDRDI